MTDSKLYSVLTHFDKIEQNRLRKYVRSPYFNVNEILMCFIDLLFSHINANRKTEKDKEAINTSSKIEGTPKKDKEAINANNKVEELPKETIWAQLYASDPFNDVRFRKLSSDLLKLIEDFLAQEKYEKDSLQRESYLLRAIGEKKMERLHKSAIKGARELLKQQDEKPSTFYYSQYLIEKSYYSMSEDELKRSEKSNVEEIINNLDHFYLAEKLKWYNAVISRKNLISHEYQLLLIDEIISHIEKYHYENVPTILIYHKLYLAQTQTENESHYFDLKKLISQYWRQFPIKEVEEIFFNLLNYCIKKLNQGNQFFLREFLDVYKEILEKNILPNNELNPWNFKNAVQIALRLGEYEWTEKFIKDYNTKLPIEFRDSALSYNLALVYFYQKKYDNVIEKLQSVDYEDIGYNLNAKSVLISVYYEINSDDALISLMESFKTYLYRHKDIPESRRTSYLNLMKYVRKLLKLNKGNKTEIEHIKKEMEEDHKIGIASEKWILEKLAELE